MQSWRLRFWVSSDIGISRRIAEKFWHVSCVFSTARSLICRHVESCLGLYSFFFSLLKSGHGNLNKKKSKPRKSKLMHEDVHQPLNLSSTNTKVFINGWNRTHPDPTHWHGVVWTKTCQDVTLQYLCLWHFCLFFFSSTHPVHILWHPTDSTSKQNM